MANTNPLEKMKIKTLIGFNHIVPGVLTGDVITDLKQCGISDVTGVTASGSVFSTGEINVLGNTFHGLKIDTDSGKVIGSLVLFSWPVSDLASHPVQAGIRLTQSGYAGNNGVPSLMMLYRKASNSSIDFTPGIVFQGEDSSLYWEIVVSAKKTSATIFSVSTDVYVNKQPVSRCVASIGAKETISLRVGPYATIKTTQPLSLVMGDIYTAELDYNSDGTVTPQLLGNLTLEPFTVASYTGDKHTNTKNQDIVMALNTLDPNNDMGVLAIKPVEQPASVTFNAPDIAGKTILGAALNIVYKDSIAPNNRLNYQITEGTTRMVAETITERNADITGYTTFSRILTTPEGGGAWNTENLKFKLDMVNKGSE
ncbi:hypothetical protein LSE82_004247 [Salmonella enterica]|nr:hypothetical protein [Salmonella enterica]